MRSQAREETLAKEVGGYGNKKQVFECGEHVQLEPEEDVEAKNAKQAGVEAKRPQRKRQISEVDSNA